MSRLCTVRAAVLAAILAAGSGCASVPMAAKERDIAAKTFSAQPDMSNVYIYRASNWGTGVKYPVTLDGRMLGELPGSTFVVASVSPGPHSVYVSAESSKTQSFTAEPGKNHYVKVTPAMGWISAGVSLTLMTDEKEAQQDIRGCNLIQTIQ
jgi:hypothetical protein